MNDQHRAGQDAPVFLHIGGEGSLGPGSVMAGKEQGLGDWRLGRGTAGDSIGRPQTAPNSHPPLSHVLFTGHPAALAPAWGALVISLEHRFYGLSMPVGGLDMAQLPYLSSRHA